MEAEHLITIAAEDPTTRDARWCIEQYFAELASRFESGFDPAISIPADPEELAPPSGVLLIARRHGQPVGCGALKFHGDEPAELKRMWVASGPAGRDSAAGSCPNSSNALGTPAPR